MKIGAYEFTANEHQWPSGQQGFQLVVNSRVVGHATKIDGGYLVFGKRKPVKTLEDAVVQCVDGLLKKRIAEIKELQEILDTMSACPGQFVTEQKP